MNFYDVLFAEKWDGGIPTINFFDLLFAQSMGGEQWQVYEGTLPATLNANGADLRQYQVWGNTGGVGEPTENLCIGKLERTNMNASGQIVYNSEFSMQFAQVTQGKTYSYKNSSTSVYGFFEAMPLLGSTSYNNQRISTTDTNVSFTAPITGYVAFRTSLNTQGMLTEGSTPPASYVPFGYEVDMGVKSAQLYDYTATDTENGYEQGYYLCPPDISGGKWANSSYAISEYIEIEGLPTITFSGYTSYYALGIENEFYNASKQRLSAFKTTTIPATINVPTSAKYVRFSIKLDKAAQIMLNAGSTPLPYQLYFSTVIPMYIGDEPLEKDEYVDYQAGKVYRMINGVLTPTDPPVTLPTLPTVDGTTIVDYVGQSVAPEKVLLEYKKGGN